MKKILYPALCAVLALSTPAFSQDKPEAEKSSAQKVIELLGGSPIDAAKAIFEPVLKQFRQQGISEAAIGEISAAADAFFYKTFNDPDFNKEMVAIYQETFTEEELQDILAFYSTPTGRKALATLPQLMQQGAKIGEKYAAKYQKDFQGEISAILERHSKAKAPKPDKDPDDE